MKCYGSFVAAIAFYLVYQQGLYKLYDEALWSKILILELRTASHKE